MHDDGGIFVVLSTANQVKLFELEFAGALSGRKRGDAEVDRLADEKAQVKKFKATETAPKHASKTVWASIFTSSRPEEKETYSCRALSSRGLA